VPGLPCRNKVKGADDSDGAQDANLECHDYQGATFFSGCDAREREMSLELNRCDS